MKTLSYKGFTEHKSVLLIVFLLLPLGLSAQATPEEIAYTAYQNGDYETAFSEWLPLAEAGNPEAQHNIALMYERGEGVEKNIEEAYLWYLSAATTPLEEGMPVSEAREQSRNRLGDILSSYPTETTGEDNQELYLEEANYWYELAAEDGVVNAEYHLGLNAALGRGMEQDYTTALVWYMSAAEQEHPEAQNNLATLYANGLGMETNAEEAVYWYRKASEQENIVAQHNLGVMHLRGEGVPQSHVNGYMWVYLARENGHSGSDKLIEELEKIMDSEAILKANELADKCRNLGYRNCGESEASTQ